MWMLNTQYCPIPGCQQSNRGKVGLHWGSWANDPVMTPSHMVLYLDLSQELPDLLVPANTWERHFLRKVSTVQEVAIFQLFHIDKGAGGYMHQIKLCERIEALSKVGSREQHLVVLPAVGLDKPRVHFLPANHLCKQTWWFLAGWPRWQVKGTWTLGVCNH